MGCDWVVCVVTTCVVAGDGGGAETTCDSSEEQPAKIASAPQTAKAGARNIVARLVGVEVLVFIPNSLTGESATGSGRNGHRGYPPHPSFLICQPRSRGLG